MAYVTMFEGIIFIEGDHPRAVKMYSADTRLGGFGAQLKNLDDLKRKMAEIARGSGCNCVVNFRYGQKTKIIAIDNIAYYGEGFYAQLPQEDYRSISSQLTGGTQF